jgi:putative hydrolase of the HAD superfamily
MTTEWAVGFDLGETLIHFQGIPLSWRDEYPAALTKVGTACALTVTPEHIAIAVPVLERYNTRLYPRTTEVAARTIFTEVLTAWELTDARHCEIAFEAFFAHFHQEVAPYEDSLPTLQKLHAAGVPVGVLTDVPYGMPDHLTRAYLTDTGLEAWAGALITSTSVGVRKPETNGYLQLAAALGVPVDRMVFVGNEPKDVEGANRAGAISVLLDREERRPDWGQQYCISDLHELWTLPEPAPLFG